MVRRSGGTVWLLGLLLSGAAWAESGWHEPYQAAQRLYRQSTARPDLQFVMELCRQALAKGAPARRLPEVHFLLGQAAYDAGEPATAVAALRAAVAGDPKSFEYRLWLGYAYHLDNRPTLAYQTFRALFLEPTVDPVTRESAARWLTNLNEPPEQADDEPPARLVIPGAIIAHHPGEPFLAAVREALLAARQQLLERLGIEVTEPIEVLLFRDAAEYQAFHRARAVARPEWSTACTINGRISTYPAAGARDGLKATFAHEYTHVALRAYADDRDLPCWLDEGLAVLLAGQFPQAQSELARAGGLLSLEALMVPSFGVYETATARLAYLQSKDLTADLLRCHGAVKIRAFLRAVGRGAPAVVAFEQAFGLTLQDFYDWWFREGVDAP